MLDHAADDQQDQAARRAHLRPVAGAVAEQAAAVVQPIRARLRVATAPEQITKLRELIEAGGLPSVYLLGSDLVRVESSPPPVNADDLPLPVRAAPLTPPLAQRLIATHVDAQRLNTRNEWAPFVPSVATVNAATAGSDWQSVPALRGVIGTPVFRSDWSLLQAKGYDQGTRLFLALSVPFAEVSRRPSADEVREARSFLLDDLLGDFPWAGPADLPNYLGLLLTPLVRHAFGTLTTPLTLITASMPSSGKTNLANVLGALVGMMTLSWPPEQNDTELEKLITSALTASGGAVIFDNVDNGEMIESTTLARLLTASVWTGRILGSTAVRSLPNDREWIITGNNVRVSGDLVSRTIVTRLEPRTEHPEERQGFKIADLESWVKVPTNRARILRALLVLVADWAAAGAKPDHSIAPMRSWTTLVQGVGGILAHHGIGGYLSNVSDIREQDDETARWAVFLDAWWHRFGSQPLKASTVFDSARYVERGPSPEPDPWDGAFITNASGRRPANAVQLGRSLGVIGGRPLAGYRLTGEKDRKGLTYWTLRRIDE